MIWVVAMALWVCLAAGLYLSLSRDLFRIALGLALVGAGVNLALLASGRLGSDQPAVIVEGESVLGVASNPLPQALVLTAIVIAFGMTALLVLLALGAYLSSGNDRQDIEKPGTTPEGRG